MPPLSSDALSGWGKVAQSDVIFSSEACHFTCAHEIDFPFL